MKLEFDTQRSMYWFPWIRWVMSIPGYRVIRMRWLHGQLDLHI